MKKKNNWENVKALFKGIFHLGAQTERTAILNKVVRMKKVNPKSEELKELERFIKGRVGRVRKKKGGL